MITWQHKYFYSDCKEVFAPKIVSYHIPHDYKDNKMSISSKQVLDERTKLLKGNVWTEPKNMGVY